MKVKIWAALVTLVVANAALAQNYPNRAVRVVVAAATGGPDLGAGVIAAKLAEQLGQPFVVENQPGANGIVGAQTVAKATPDGYTLLVYSSGFVINPFVYKSLPYDTEKDFTPVTNLVSNGGLFFAVANSIPAKNMQEFLEFAKKPGTQLAYSTPGVGNTRHLAGHRRQALARSAQGDAGSGRARPSRQDRCRARGRFAGGFQEIRPGRAQGLRRTGAPRGHQARITFLDLPGGEAAADDHLRHRQVVDQLEAAAAGGAVRDQPVAHLLGAVARRGQFGLEELDQLV